MLTDLDPQQAQVSWYRLRTWIEGGFKDFKRGLWGWQNSTRTQESYGERLWLAMALAQRWCLSVGIRIEEQEKQRVLPPLEERLPERHVARRKREQAPSVAPAARRLRCVLRGRLHLLALLFLAQPLTVGCLHPEVWPQTIVAPQKHVLPGLRHGTKIPRDKARRRRSKQRAYQRSKALS